MPYQCLTMQSYLSRATQEVFRRRLEERHCPAAELRCSLALRLHAKSLTSTPCEDHIPAAAQRLLCCCWLCWWNAECKEDPDWEQVVVRPDVGALILPVRAQLPNFEQRTPCASGSSYRWLHGCRAQAAELL